jgi:hypothetical protein
MWPFCFVFLGEHLPGEDRTEEQQESREDHPGNNAGGSAAVTKRARCFAGMVSLSPVAKQEQTDNVCQEIEP